MWSFGPHNSSHFLDNQIREILFRESILAFFGAPPMSGDSNKKDPVSAYCQSCKQAKKDIDCSKCDKKIEVMKDGGER